MTFLAKQSIPRLLLALLMLVAAMLLGAGAVFYLSFQHALKSSAATTDAMVTKLDRTYFLLETISGDLNNLQQFLRLEDPDAIEKAIKALEASEKTSAALIDACGQSGLVLKTKVNALAAANKQVIDLFLKGQNAQANEKFLTLTTPRSAEVLDEIRNYHKNIQTEARTEQSVRRSEIERSLVWRSALLLAALVGVLMSGWFVKTHITRKLSAIASSLSQVSDITLGNANQVASASQGLAQGANDQAASLQETSASLEEISSMTQRNAENTLRASDLAKIARQSADLGVSDIQSMTKAMGEISSSSAEIGKIIKTIDEIAFQTNILALNAAVEAARAGEAGMGFAVVAEEVRNLAQRSAAAARETAIKIENAITNTAQGVQISGKATQSLNEIAVKVREVNDLVSEVATASDEQSRGIGQINAAVASMDKVTQSNAATAEESAAAATELNSQAHILKNVIDDLRALVGSNSIEHRSSPTTVEAPPPAKPNPEAKALRQSKTAHLPPARVA